MDIFRKGWRTSEFWVSVGAMVSLVTGLGGHLPERAQGPVAIVAAGFALARAIAKLAGAQVEAAAVTNPNERPTKKDNP